MTTIEIKSDIKRSECCYECTFLETEHGFDEKEWHDYTIDRCSITKENVGYHFKNSPDGSISPNCPITKWEVKS